MNALLECSLWALWVCLTGAIIGGAALLFMFITLEELPEDPSSLDRFRHALWRSI